ncbi:MAG: hypothetical protein ACO4BU_11460, partial [Phycisphaerales bacterium]
MLLQEGLNEPVDGSRGNVASGPHAAREGRFAWQARLRERAVRVTGLALASLGGRSLGRNG